MVEAFQISNWIQHNVSDNSTWRGAWIHSDIMNCTSHIRCGADTLKNPPLIKPKPETTSLPECLKSSETFWAAYIGFSSLCNSNSMVIHKHAWQGYNEARPLHSLGVTSRPFQIHIHNRHNEYMKSSTEALGKKSTQDEKQAKSNDKTKGPEALRTGTRSSDRQNWN